MVLSCKMSLLLSESSLGSSLRLLMLLPISLINSMRNSLATDPLPHLSPFTLARLNCTDQANPGLGSVLVASNGNERAARHPRDVFLLACRQVRRDFAAGQSKHPSLAHRATR